MLPSVASAYERRFSEHCLLRGFDQVPITITAHARQRMWERRIPEAVLLDIVETGVDKEHVPGRTDDLVCVAAVIAGAVVVKTVMNHWEFAP